ncbi:MAG: Smr/MutS family protein, partial [Gemmatimonadota bacterium]
RLEAREDVEDAIDELEEAYRASAPDAAGETSGDRSRAASRARSRVESALRESRAARPETSTGVDREPADVSPGDPVRIVSLDRSATVREVREERAVVEAGHVRLTLPLTDLEPVDEETAETKPAPARASASGTAPAAGLEPRSEVHLRGLRVSEVERELLPYLDAAIVADLPRLRVVHGKGTGALRKRVRELLASDPRVERFRDGAAGEGGRGVTVVELGSDRD